MGEQKPGEHLSVSVPERRSHPRYSVEEDSVLLLMSHGAAMPGRIENLSVSGCRVRTRERISAEAGSRIEISFKVSGVAFRFNSVLAWTIGWNLVGIRFVDLIPRRKAELAEILGEMESASAERADPVNAAVANHETRSPPIPNAKQRASEHRPMPEDSGAGKSTVVAASAPASASPAATQTAHAPSPSDRRICARHTVDTSAIILLINVGSTLRGRIVDLSLSGCRIRTDERFPVGIFTRVETEFRLQGLPFRLGGVIQAIHDRNAVGIRFLDLSDRKRQQVAELIGEIQQIQDAPMAVEAHLDLE